MAIQTYRRSSRSLNKNNINYKCCNYNGTIEWEERSITHEPIPILGHDVPEIYAEYRQKHDLLDEPRWKQFQHIAKSKKKLQHMINAPKMKSFHNTVQYMYSVHIPCNTKKALKLDEENGNDNWKKVIRLEIQQLMDYDTVLKKGLRNQMPNDYTKIRCHMIFAVKHNGQQKTRFVAGGHLTQPAIESVYSGEVSMCIICLMLLIAELNDLEAYQADFGNAYLEAYTEEKDIFYPWKTICTFVWKVMFSLYLKHYIWVMYKCQMVPSSFHRHALH